MRIGIVTVWQERGAGYVSRQFKDVLASEHKVFVYARGGEGYAIGNPNWDDGTITWGKKLPLGVPMSIDLIDFKKWIIRNKIDVVFFNEQQWWDPVLMCVQMGIKTGSYVDYYTKETVPLFALYDFLVCNTKRHYSAFSWHPQVVYLPWGTNLRVFKPHSLEQVNPGYLTFFHSAGMSPERKGTDLVLEAFMGVRGKAKLIIHTQVSLMVAFPQLRKMISLLTDCGLLEVCEKTLPAPGLYHLGDVYVYPSRLEGIGLSLIEATACGLPVITSDNPPMNEFVDDTNGVLTKIDGLHPRSDGYYWPVCEPNVDDVRKKMQAYVDDILNISAKKKSARLHAEEKFNWFMNARELPVFFAKSKIISLKQKTDAIQQARWYEEKRSSVLIKLYRIFPWSLSLFGLFWPIIRRRYIRK